MVYEALNVTFYSGMNLFKSGLGVPSLLFSRETDYLA
jgi:hypothetical protein